MNIELFDSARVVDFAADRRFRLRFRRSAASGSNQVAAQIEGILTEENGCLRVTSDHDREPQGRALVWQKPLFKIERRGDNVLIVDLFGPNRQPAPTVIWRLGDMIRGGGGVIGPAGADDHAGAGFSERCAGPYFLVSMVVQ